MQESLIHTIWLYRLYSPQITTTEGEKIIVQSTGLHNLNGGPDFLEAKIKIGNTTWAGHVECHVHEKDWVNHKHHLDKKYDNVVLHVVWESQDFSPKVNSPILELKNWVHQSILSQYHNLTIQGNDIPCIQHQMQTEKSEIWMEQLYLERLIRKTELIHTIYKKEKGDLEKTAIRFLLQKLGGKVNADTFDFFARSLDISILQKYVQSPSKLEALLFAWSGLLPDCSTDQYINSLIQEGEFLLKKHQIKPFEGYLFQFARMRPYQFPTRILFQFIQLLLYSKGIHQLLNSLIVADWKKLEFEEHPYWSYNFSFKPTTSKTLKTWMGEMIKNSAYINIILPYQLFSQQQIGIIDNEQIIDQIRQIEFEKNSITKKFGNWKIQKKSALHSQSLIEVYTEYCSNKKCLSCSKGLDFLKKQSL